MPNYTQSASGDALLSGKLQNVSLRGPRANRLSSLQDNPTIFPFSSRSIFLKAGLLERPGMVLISPHRG